MPRPGVRLLLVAAGSVVTLVAASAIGMSVGPTEASQRRAAAEASVAKAMAAKQRAIKVYRSLCVPSNSNVVTAQALSAALTKHDQKAFLALAGTSSARATMTRWWSNVTALGFTTGAAELDAYARGFNIGWRTALDDSTPASAGPKGVLPDIGSTSYALRSAIRWDGRQCRVSITDWDSQSNAPWDLKQQLYVKRTPHTIVAGEKRSRAAVDHAAALSEFAWTWLHGFLKANGHEADLPPGFMVFVPSSNRQGLTWFEYDSDDEDDDSWINDPSAVEGLTQNLPSITPSLPYVLDAPTTPTLFSGSMVTRVVLQPSAIRNEPLRYQQGVAVHEFTHATYDRASDLRQQIDSATAEGAASFVEATFRASPTSYTGRAMSQLLKDIRYDRSRFNGRVPGENQIYGSARYSGFYYSVAGSAFAYLASKHGVPYALESIRQGHEQGSAPLGDDPALERAWASWLRSQL